MCVKIKQGLVDVLSGLQQNIVDSAVGKLRKASVSLCSRTGEKLNREKRRQKS